MGSAQIASIVLQFGTSLILARLIAPREFGIFALAMAIAGVLSLIQALGLKALIVREHDLSDAIKATAFTINALISITLTIAILVTAYAGGILLKEEGVRQVLLAIAPVPLIGIVTFLPGALLERLGQFKVLAVAAFASGAAGAVVTVAFAFQGASYMSFAYGQWAQAIVSAVVICVAGRQFTSFAVGFASWRTVSEFGVQMFAVAGIAALAARLADFTLGNIVGLAALGLYSRATNLNGIIWNNIHIVLGRILLVDFATLLRGGSSLRERYIRVVDIVTAVLWPAFLGLAVLSKPLILVLYGADWVEAALPLTFIALASVVQVSVTMTWELFASTGNLRTQTKIEIIRSTVGLILFAGGCFISLEAAAFTRIVDAILAYLLYRKPVNAMTDTVSADYTGIYLRNAFLALLAVTPALVLMATYQFSADVPIVGLVLVIGLGVALWGMALAAARHPVFLEVRSLVLRKAGA